MVNSYMTDVESNIVYFVGEKEWKPLTNDGGGGNFDLPAGWWLIT